VQTAVAVFQYARAASKPAERATALLYHYDFAAVLARQVKS